MASAAPPPVLSRRALNRALLARQLLLERAAMPALDAVEHLVGMQSQVPLPPYLGLWTRLSGFRPDELSELLGERRAVRLALMRSTIHLVSADDALLIRPVLAEALARALRGAFGRGLDGVDLDAVVAAGRKLVEERPLTLGGLGALLAEQWPDRDPASLANAVRNLVPLVQTPPRGLWGGSGPAVHTTAEAWLGRPLADSTSADALVLRYLAAFGPASVKDVQAWSGMTRLAASIARLRPQLLTFRDESGMELFDLPDAPRPDAETPSPVRFLPEFDNILLSHADRGRIVSEERRRLTFTSNGLIRSAILVDGEVGGLWRIERTRDSTVLAIAPFVPLAPAVRTALAEEGARLLAFAAAGTTGHDVRFS